MAQLDPYLQTSAVLAETIANSECGKPADDQAEEARIVTDDMQFSIIESCSRHYFHSKAIIWLFDYHESQQLARLKGCVVYGKSGGGSFEFFEVCVKKGPEICCETSATLSAVLVPELDYRAFDPHRCHKSTSFFVAIDQVIFTKFHRF